MGDLGTQAPIEAVYTERNQAVAVLVALAKRLGYHVWVNWNADDPDWPIVFVDLPSYGAGQVSWHIPYEEMRTFFPDKLPIGGGWDGHDNAEKARRLIVEAKAK